VRSAATSGHTLWSDFSCSSFSTNKYAGNAFIPPCSILRHLCSLVNNSWSYLSGLTSVAHPVCAQQQLPVILFGLTSVAHFSAHTSMQGMHIYPLWYTEAFVFTHQTLLAISLRSHFSRSSSAVITALDGYDLHLNSSSSPLPWSLFTSIVYGTSLPTSLPDYPIYPSGLTLITSLWQVYWLPCSIHVLSSPPEQIAIQDDGHGCKRI
jgi:hypothetical protein